MWRRALVEWVGEGWLGGLVARGRDRGAQRGWGEAGEPQGREGCSAATTAGLMVPLPGRLFGLLYWWVGTTWYRLTTAASLLDVFVLTR